MKYPPATPAHLDVPAWLGTRAAKLIDQADMALVPISILQRLLRDCGYSQAEIALVPEIGITRVVVRSAVKASVPFVVTHTMRLYTDHDPGSQLLGSGNGNVKKQGNS